MICGGGEGEGEYIQTRSRLSCFCVFVGAVFKLRWIWQVMWILKQTIGARLCDKYHNIVLARLQFAHTNVAN